MRFQSCLDDCKMIEMGFNGAKYTWLVELKVDNGAHLEEIG